MQIKAFFDQATYTLTYVLHDAETRRAIVVDPVLDFDPASGKIAKTSIDEVLRYVREQRLDVQMILETHAHADHLSSSQVVKEAFPQAKLAIGAPITKVQEVFKPLYGFGAEFHADGSQFDLLLNDGDRIDVGGLHFEVLLTPGHTPACASYLFGDVVFTGDTLFMPDSGVGRADFPGGSAEALFDSVQRLYRLPDATRVFTGHDYQPNGRPLQFESTIGQEKSGNVILRGDTPREQFVKQRRERDRTLAAPRLIHPSVQVNIAAGRLPEPDKNGRRYLKIPLSVAL